MSFFLIALPICSALTALITEGIKTLLKEWNKEYKPNTLAGIMAVLVAIGYMVYWHFGDGAAWATETLIIMGVLLIICSWLCAMLGYDKVIQTIQQWHKSEGES